MPNAFPAPPPPATPDQEAPQCIPAQVPPQVGERLLSAAPFFYGMSRQDVAEAATAVRAFECPTGALLLSQESGPSGLGLLVSGKARAFAGETHEGNEAVEELQAPDLFGEVGVLTGGTNAYSVVAEAQSRVLFLPGDVVARLMERAPKLSSMLAQRLAIRFQRLCRPAPAALLLSELEPELTPLPKAHAAPPPPERGLPPGTVPYVETSDFDIQPSVVGLVAPKTVRQHRALPLKLVGKRLTLGLVAPRNQAAIMELTRSLQAFELEFVAIGQDDFNAALQKFRIDERSRPGEKEKLRIDPDQLTFETAADDAQDRAPAQKAIGEEVIRAAARIIAAALDRDASDIHLEPLSTGIRVRFRVSGTLQDWTEQIPPQLARGVIARFKVVAGLDITERRRPQDGRIGVKAGKRDFDLRVSCLPSSRGEKLVFRVLDGAMSTKSLGQLFVDARVLALARKALNRPYGGIIIAGATGAGKTSTLYAMLNERRVTRPDTHIVMVEDPIEYRLEGVTQVQVDQGAGLNFAGVLRSMLRQDPDVIVVGEMRDAETARIGLEAAMTGHVLLTSLHANQAVGAIERLAQLGCGRPLMSQSLSLVLVQRLVRRLCSACRTTADTAQPLVESLISRRVLEAGASRILPHAVGCDACKQTGYVGRVAVVEALQLTDDLRHLLAADHPLPSIETQALESGALVPFSASASYLLKEGLITPSEALLIVAE